jgi:hypothetical protein
MRRRGDGTPVTKILIILSSLLQLLTSASAYAGDGPFGKIRPDYEIKREQVTRFGDRFNSQTLVHHKGWVKLSMEWEMNGARQVIYYRPFQGPSFFLSYSDKGEFYQARAFIDPPLIRGESELIDLKKQEKYLGETCEVWEVRQSKSVSGSTICVTKDGVLLAEVLHDRQDGAVAFLEIPKKLTRRVVFDKEIALPDNAFDFAYWFADSMNHVKADRPPDYEITYDDGGRRIQRFPWILMESKNEEGGRELKIWNQVTQQGLRYNTRSDSSFRALDLTISPSEHKPKPFAESSSRRVAMEEFSSILGERCRWFDMEPGYVEIPVYHCVTTDDLPLIIWKGKEGKEHEQRATAIHRGEVKVEKLYPPREIFEPIRQAIEDQP